MIMARQYRSTRKKAFPNSTSSTKILHGRTWYRTQDFVVKKTGD